jgi:hypothetical protein
MSQSEPELKVTDHERLTKLDPEVIEKVTSDLSVNQRLNQKFTNEVRFIHLKHI